MPTSSCRWCILRRPTTARPHAGPADPLPPFQYKQVVKNQAAYYHQARVEIGVLQFLNTRADPGDAHHIVRLKVCVAMRAHCQQFVFLR